MKKRENSNKLRLVLHMKNKRTNGFSFRGPIMALVTVTVSGLALTGCSGADMTRAFGLRRDAPDEYTVTTRAPLSMPPSDDLQTPREGAPRPQDESPRLQALETLSPNVALEGVNGTSSTGQEALGSEAQATSPQGRQELGHPESGFVNNVMFWNRGEAGSVVDGDAENARLKHNSAMGKSPIDGTTPTVKDEKNDSGFLGVF